ncbi:flagellar hook-length control protein FliK [Pluralibacter gergoviae]
MAAAPRALTQAAALREAVRDELPARMSALLPTSSAAEGAVAPLHAARQVGAAAAAQPEAAAAPVMTARPAPDVSPWAQQLKSALGERLQIQLKNQIQHATIRLDPPEMGKIDIALKLDGGRMQVHISAGQADVYRALQQTSGELRQMLVGHHVDQVTVQVSAQSGQQQQGRGHAAGEPPQTAIAAAAEMADAGASGLRQQDDSVLLTV